MNSSNSTVLNEVKRMDGKIYVAFAIGYIVMTIECALLYTSNDLRLVDISHEQ